jgi:hypothetical protein
MLDSSYIVSRDNQTTKPWSFSARTLPETVCEFNVLEPSSVSAGTQYKYSDFFGKDDHTYAKPWTDNQTTFTLRKILRKGCSHELYILLAKLFEIPNQRAKSLNSKLNISFINTRSNWSATSSWKENVFSIFISLTKVKNFSFVECIIHGCQFLLKSFKAW